ncbi:acyl-CoA carboxylase subunit epsilon [Actinomadura parmotrematis]|uniref:Acyl-CoA carboxylase subunit epsilon n=1 Tax=Actinomadura parmotrematis TaxID=2864039 RepID=A0ABS7FWA0_9ACTN|nr:acyl-CoA carboxylase subunit epsilon [Actinomadura parmotrematis]MBW8484694.1 acyl-CoA carboxylase subunit epsilon [Actinomadura parmotrematis]
MGSEGKPFLQIVRGDPGPEEIAALVAVLTARAQAAAAARDGGVAGPPSRWADRSRLLRRQAAAGVRPAGPGAWRASGLPS